MTDKESTEKSAFQDVCNIYNDLLKFKEVKQNKFEYTEKDDVESQNVKDLKDFHSECEKKYERFFYSFPILARFIVFSDMFNAECLKNFFKYYFTFKELPKSYDEFCDRQCEYVYMFNLNMVKSICNRNGGRKLKMDVLEAKAKKEKDNIKNKLVEEYNNFLKIVEDVKVNDKESESQLKKERLRSMILSMAKKESSDN